MQCSLPFDDESLRTTAAAQAIAAELAPSGVDMSLLPFKPRDYQESGIRNAFELFDAGAEGAIFRQPTGCHAKGQGVLMFDGTVKKAEDVEVDDVLMGPDSGPRWVERLCRGRDVMVRIHPTKGRSFVVNMDHVLTLVKTDEGDKPHTNRDRTKAGQIIDVTVREWLGWSKWKKHIHKLFRVPVEFVSGYPLPLDPYFVGVLLGDGSLDGRVAVTTADPEIESFLADQAVRLGARLRIEPAGGKSNSHYFTIDRVPGERNRNHIADFLRTMSMFGVKCCSKSVPSEYLTASRADRLACLAGLIDTDGSATVGGYDFITKSHMLSRDVQFLARSVGLAAYERLSFKGCQTGAKGWYFRVSISGDCGIIPCKIPRKQHGPRRQKKDPLRTGFSAEILGEDDYYGFTLSGDGRYLLDDFTVTHNSGKTVSGSAIALLWLHRDERNRVLVLCHERQLVQQFAEEIEAFTKVRPGIEMADSVVSAKFIPEITVASRQTLLERTVGGRSATIRTANEALPEGCEFDPDYCDDIPSGPALDLEPQKASRLYKFDAERFNWLVIFDECHRYAYKLKSVRHIVDWFAKNPSSRRLGLTATPERGDKVSLSRLFPEIASDYRLYDVDGGPCAVRDGWAVPYDQRFVTVHGVDFKTLREVSGDFDETQLEELLTERKNMLSMIRPTLDIVGDRRTIIFNPTVGMAKMVAHTINEFARFQCQACESIQWEHVDDMATTSVPCKKCGGMLEELAAGMVARSLDGSFPDHARRECYAQFAAAGFQFLSVCGLCREGFNDPGIGAVAIFRPTKSRSLAEQMKGRGCRPLRGIVDGLSTAEERVAAIRASTKPTCIVVDLVGVTGMADCASTAHILAEGKPDEVIELANKRALEKSEAGESVDIGEEIRTAEADIEAEKRRKREEDEEKAREQLRAKQEAERLAAERMRKLRGDVDYSEHQVEPGGGGAVEGKRERVARMPFGKHVGKSVSELPGGYIRAMLENNVKMPPWLKDSLKGELRRREDRRHDTPKPLPRPQLTEQSPCTPQQARVLEKFGKPSNVTAGEAVKLIAEINQQLKAKSFQQTT